MMQAKTSGGTPLTININLGDTRDLVETLRMLLTRVTFPTAIAEPIPESRSCTLPPADPPTVGDSSGVDSHKDLPDQLNLQQAFERHVLPTLRIECKPATISCYKTAVKHFCTWYSERNQECAENNLRSYGPKVVTLEQSPQLLAEYYSHCLTSGSEKTGHNKLKALRAVWRMLHSDGHISRPAPDPRTRQIRKQLSVDRVKHIPIPASDDEVSALLQAVLDSAGQLTWPRLGTLRPCEFWFNVIAACTVHGFRPADLWPLEKRCGKGLLWSEVCSDPSPPIDGGESSRLNADWEFGWLRFRINKTGGQLLAPISPHLAWLIHRCRGLDPLRVFPLPYARKSWYAAIDLIKRTAGLSRDVSLCGQAPSASLRKTSAVIWKRSAGRAAASHMLGHSVRSGSSDDVFSDVTEQHYMGADVLREVVQGFPAVLANLPRLIRC